MISKIKIANKFIGENCPVFIIAEAGVNHNGDLDKAIKLIDAAVEAKADAVKFQTFIAEEEVTEKTPKADYQKDNSKSGESYYEMIKKLELNEKQHKTLMEYCAKKGIIFLSTPSEEKSAKMLNNLGVPAFKIGSNDIITLPMLEKVSAYKKPMIISRGMANYKEIKEAIGVIRGEGNNEIILLHCTSNYPAKPEELNLGAIKTLKNKFDVLVGYSDHSIGLDASIVASLLGAVVIEKHITLDKKLPGPDQKFALNPEEFRQMITKIRETEFLSGKEKIKKLESVLSIKKMLGSSEINPVKSEEKMAKVVRKSIVAKKDIKKGDIISINNIAFKRPGTGIPANLYKKIIGKKIKKNIKKDELIKLEDLA